MLGNEIVLLFVLTSGSSSLYSTCLQFLVPSLITNMSASSKKMNEYEILLLIDAGEQPAASR